jgi:hypothetical protein
VAIEGLRTAEHRLPGWESSSRSTGRPDPTKLRHEAREACSNRRRAPLSDGGAAENPERLRFAPCPEARLRPTARTVGSSNEPRCLHAARNHGSSPWPFRRLQRSRTKASIFRACRGAPWTGHTTACAAEKPPRWLSMRSGRFACGVRTTFCETCRPRAEARPAH